MQAGFAEVMDTETMFAKDFAEMRQAAAAASLKKVGPGRRCKDRRPGPLDAPSKHWRDYFKLSEICLKPAWVLLAMSLTWVLRSTH